MSSERSDPRYRFLVTSRNSAKAKGLDHTLSLDDIVVPRRCPVFGYELRYGGRADNSATIDRLDSSKGYIPGNVGIISFRANRLKSNGTIEDFRKILAYMESIGGEDDSSEHPGPTGSPEEVQLDA